jgi:hypothetical protein
MKKNPITLRGERISVEKFMIANNYDIVKPIQANVPEGYLCVTFINSNNPESNDCIFFSKYASVNFEVGQIINLSTTFIVSSTDDHGKPLLKLTNYPFGSSEETLVQRGYTIVDLTGVEGKTLAPVNREQAIKYHIMMNEALKALSEEDITAEQQQKILSDNSSIADKLIKSAKLKGIKILL